MSRWKDQVEAALRARDAPAALDRALLSRFAASANGASVPASTLTHWINNLCARGLLKRVIGGVFLNVGRAVAPVPADAAYLLRNDAVVSLNTVLGDAGVLNNPSNTVTAIVPIDKGESPPRTGRVKTGIGAYHFFAMPRRVLEAGKVSERIDDRYVDHVRATPERALLDWFYLANSRFSRRTMPNPDDLDLQLLDRARLKRLAKAMAVDLPPFAK